MNKHNIKVGDTVRIVRDKSIHLFEIGKKVKVTEIVKDASEGFIRCSDGNRTRAVLYSDIEPATPEHTFDGWAVFNDKGELCKHTIATTQLEAKGGLINDWKELSERGCTINPVTVTVKIKHYEKED